MFKDLLSSIHEKETFFVLILKKFFDEDCFNFSFRSPTLISSFFDVFTNFASLQQIERFFGQLQNSKIIFHLLSFSLIHFVDFIEYEVGLFISKFLIPKAVEFGSTDIQLLLFTLISKSRIDFNFESSWKILKDSEFNEIYLDFIQNVQFPADETILHEIWNLILNSFLKENFEMTTFLTILLNRRKFSTSKLTPFIQKLLLSKEKN